MGMAASPIGDRDIPIPFDRAMPDVPALDLYLPPESWRMGMVKMVTVAPL